MVACYKMFIAGLLYVTDNVDRSSGKVTTTDRVVRRYYYYAYLVDGYARGTATPNIANKIANFDATGLGDAFASGGSVGYDHKEMGITARGAWKP